MILVRCVVLQVVLLREGVSRVACRAGERYDGQR